MGLDVRKIRSFSKKVLSGNKFIFDVSRSSYYKLKLVLDFLIFKSRYFDCFWKIKFVSSDYKGFSQHGQDIFLIEFLGKKGFYVEIGCNHPFRLSNTALLEAHGWSGCSIDPLSKYSLEWKSKRKNKFINAAIGEDRARKKFVEFYGDEDWVDMMSGFLDCVRNEDIENLKYHTYDVDVFPLSEILGDEVVDLLLIDVEGAEIEILKGIDFDSISVGSILIENASEIGGSDHIRRYLEKRGYKLVGRIGATDDYFVKSSSLSAYPSIT